MPPLATPINPSTFQKTSNSWNLNPNSHQKTSKSALPPTTYAELYETKTDCEECYSFCLKTGQIMNLGGFPRNWKNILSDQLKDENDTYDNDIYYAPYQHMTTEPLIDSTKLIIIVDDVVADPQWVHQQGGLLHQSQHQGRCNVEAFLP
ncbi:hypothetical protein PPACK8108_LOCUS15039 [Phakopsora pachyrhizi]|uniref:Uncharacterized protein n=1 Tax=Phakopsora pachyrhizi TaxID=170000 RepID=A0AAV0B5R1_PHAPC|nr:hypothetical protein PPACK8108_LOCUS15039 [Phakopsora pachyrhizi]